MFGVRIPSPFPLPFRHEDNPLSKQRYTFTCIFALLRARQQTQALSVVLQLPDAARFA